MAFKLQLCASFVLLLVPSSSEALLANTISTWFVFVAIPTWPTTFWAMRINYFMLTSWYAHTWGHLRLALRIVSWGLLVSRWTIAWWLLISAHGWHSLKGHALRRHSLWWISHRRKLLLRVNSSRWHLRRWIISLRRITRSSHSWSWVHLWLHHLLNVWVNLLLHKLLWLHDSRLNLSRHASHWHVWHECTLQSI